MSIQSSLVTAFIEAASAPRDHHPSGTLEEANALLAAHPTLPSQSLYAAALLGDEAAVRAWLARDPAAATAKGGPRDCDALTYLCFSRYLRLNPQRGDAFVRTAQVLLAAGAPVNTGWVEMIDHPNPQPMLETAIYGAAGVAQHPALTKLLLDHGVDPNDGETPYHVSESRDNTVLRLLLERDSLNPASLAIMLIRKCDCHDAEGLRLLLEKGANPNTITMWGIAALHQALRRDNRLEAVELLLQYGADPLLNTRDGLSAVDLAAQRGRADALQLFAGRGTPLAREGVLALLTACACDQPAGLEAHQAARPELLAHGGTYLAQFAGVGNVAGVGHLLHLGVPPTAITWQGDAYFGTAPRSTALHVAAWRARPDVVCLLLSRGAPVDARDGWGRTALQLAVKACVDSYWLHLRSPESVRALLAAGASPDGIAVPTGYAEVDVLLNPAR